MILHQRAIDLLLDVQNALTRTDKLSEKDIQDLLRKGENVLRHLLARDVPVQDGKP